MFVSKLVLQDDIAQPEAFTGWSAVKREQIWPRCHMRQRPDRDTDVKTPGAGKLWSDLLAKKVRRPQPWTNKGHDQTLFF